MAVDNLEESYSLPSSSTNEFFEPITAKCRPGIQIKGLTKKFGDSKVAVKNLNLNMYEDEVFGELAFNMKWACNTKPCINAKTSLITVNLCV